MIGRLHFLTVYAGGALRFREMVISPDLGTKSKVGGIASVTWTARYHFAETKRPVINHGVTVMKIECGKIVQQTDLFDVRE